MDRLVTPAARFPSRDRKGAVYRSTENALVMPMTGTPPESAAAPVWPHSQAPARAAGQTGDKAIDTGAAAGENEEHGGGQNCDTAATHGCDRLRQAATPTATPT